MPKISIITPIYNCVDDFESAFSSVIKQTFTDFEWLIIDDCSTDSTYKKVASLIAGHDNFVLLKTNKNSGAAVARNLGIENAKGDYIAFLDSDDAWKENKLKTQLDFMESNSYDFTYTDYDVLRNNKIKLYSPRKKFEDYKTLLRHSDIGCSTVMYCSKRIGKFFMPIDAPKREDYAAWLDITKKGINGYKLSQSLTVYKIGAQSVSSKKLKLLPYAYNVYRIHEKMNFLKSHFYLFCVIFNKIFLKY